MRRFLPIALLTFLALLAYPLAARTDREPTTVGAAWRARTSNVIVTGRGTVTRLLRDDTRGSRHQRFLLRVDSGPTVLVAHNIDLAPRVSPLRKGDRIEFRGEYEWTDKGGTIHWTHRDPAGRHTNGWLKRGTATFQ